MAGQSKKDKPDPKAKRPKIVRNGRQSREDTGEVVIPPGTFNEQRAQAVKRSASANGRREQNLETVAEPILQEHDDDDDA
jgi:hypothetical protein